MLSHDYLNQTLTLITSFQLQQQQMIRCQQLQNNVPDLDDPPSYRSKRTPVLSAAVFFDAGNTVFLYTDPQRKWELNPGGFIAFFILKIVEHIIQRHF